MTDNQQLGVAIASVTVAVAQLGLQGIQQKKDKKGKEVPEDIGNQMRSIGSELLVIQSFLNQADMRKGYDQIFESWIPQVRKVAYRTHDLVDDYKHFVSHEQGYRFGDITKKIVQRDRHSVDLTEIGTKLKQIKEEITHLSQMKERWIRMPSHAREGSSRQSADAHFLDEEELAGIEESREMLLRLLQSEQSALSVISVWGMGGLGKTTLVANVYKSECPNFGCHAWISISQSYKIDDVLRILISELFGEDRVPDNIQSMDERRLKEILRRYLEYKRYLLILDDVWNPKAFHDLRDCLVDNQQGSRIIITTRIDGVASLAQDGCKLQLKPLGGHEAWDLFCKRTFWRGEDRVCPSEIEKCAKEIVTKCQGLPLAIVSIGILLSSEQQTESKWKRILRQFNWELEHNPSLEDLRTVLNLSYQDLPTNLKSCFLYCSVFPEDYLPSKKRLIRLLIAEGFVENKGSSALEEVAEDNLNELITRGMLQVVERKFRLHHLMREFALFISRKASFHAVYDSHATTLEEHNDARRLAVCSCSEDMLSRINLPLLRTFLSFDNSFISSSFLSSNLSKSRYLTVLDLEGAAIETVTDEIFYLFNLRYLSLRNSKVKSLPESIRNLYNLETLDLFGSRIKELPRGIVKLKKLLYLNVMEVKHRSEIPTPPEAPKGLWKMKALQTLKGVKVSRDLVEGLKSMTKVRSLAICELKDFHFMQLGTSLSQMSLLSQLSLSINYYKHEILHRGERRQLLFCDGWLPNLPSLRKLQLKGCYQKEVPRPSLSQLPNIVDYLFEDSYMEQQLRFRAGWFPNLQSLIIEDMSCVNLVKMEKGTMVNLHTLVLKDLQELKQVPEGIEFLPSLKNINFSKSHPELKARLQESDIQSKLQHVPNIDID